MRTLNSKLFYIITLVMVGWMMSAEAWAHRDRGPNDLCRRQIGDSLLHLTLYQPQFDPVAEYCEEAPRTGKTVMVVDVTDGELRQTPIGLEVIEIEVSGQSRIIQSLPAKIYELGVVDTEVLLTEGNDYVVRVTLELGSGRQAQVLVFPIRVAAWYRAMLMPALIVVGLLVLTAISVIRYYVTARQDESLAA